MSQTMVRLQRFELKIRLLGFQDTPDSAPMVPRPSEPKLGGSGPRARKPGPGPDQKHLSMKLGIGFLTFSLVSPLSFALGGSPLVE